MGSLTSSLIADAKGLNTTTSYVFRADTKRITSAQAIWTAEGAVSASVTLQYSNDNVHWENYAASTSFTAPGSKMWGDVGNVIDALYWRVAYTHVSGASDTFKVFIANISR